MGKLASPSLEEIVASFKVWYKTSVIDNQIVSVRKAGKIDSHNINPFLVPIVYSFFSALGASGSKSKTVSEGIASALVYQKIAGTSISTTLGTKFQQFIAAELEKHGRGGASVASGMDLEFFVENSAEVRTGYMQLKLGPQTINSDDVTTIINHFQDVRRLGSTNSKKIRTDDFFVGVIYGTPEDLSANYKKIQNEGYKVLIGEELWTALFGQPLLYSSIVTAAAEFGGNAPAGSPLLAELVKSIQVLSESKEIIEIAKVIQQNKKS